MKAWIKGGIILGCIHVLIWLVIRLTYADLFMLFSFLDLPLAFFEKYLPFDGLISLLILGTIQWFIIGIVFGFIIGKFKK